MAYRRSAKPGALEDSMDQQAIRSQIPVAGTVVYMSTGWSGPSPTSVVEVTAARLQGENSLGQASPTEAP